MQMKYHPTNTLEIIHETDEKHENYDSIDEIGSSFINNNDNNNN